MIDARRIVNEALVRLLEVRNLNGSVSNHQFNAILDKAVAELEPATTKRLVHKSASTGAFVSAEQAAAHPDTTFSQTVTVPLPEK